MSETPDTAAWRRNALLSVPEMYEADRSAMTAGVSGPELMENAGRSIAHEIFMRWKARPVIVLCGPGNNGGDGFVVARLLADAGWPVRVALFGARNRLRGDAAWAADLWRGTVEPLTAASIDGAAMIVDALFGAGLDRPLQGDLKQIVEAMAAAQAIRVAVDVPSGVSGDSGAILGAATPTDLTVTFFRRKPGHLLLPGRQFCGETKVTDIGIPENVLSLIEPMQAANDPGLWREMLHEPTARDHKYTRGHLGVIAGPMTGAARLAASAAARAGAGMVSIIGTPDEISHLGPLPASLVVSEIATPEALAEFVKDRRISALVVGPGRGRSGKTRDWVEAALNTGLPTVVDADGLSAFAGDPDALFGLSKGRPAVLTPHEGEFARLFGVIENKLGSARDAARVAGAALLLKGADTVVADPNGRAVINDNAPPWLATAGAGDVLSGVVGALLARRIAPFSAAAAGAWLTGDAASRAGEGLIADDLPGEIASSIRTARMGPDIYAATS